MDFGRRLLFLRIGRRERGGEGGGYPLLLSLSLLYPFLSFSSRFPPSLPFSSPLLDTFTDPSNPILHLHHPYPRNTLTGRGLGLNLCPKNTRAPSSPLNTELTRDQSQRR